MKSSSTSSHFSRESTVIKWLLEDDQPSVKYLTLVDLLDYGEHDPEVRGALSKIGTTGWAADQLREQGPEGFWESHRPQTIPEWMEFLFDPPYLATNWRALVLADLGLDSSDPRIKKIAELIFRYKLSLSSPVNFFYEEVCRAGNTARMLTRFGYGEDYRVQKLYDWLVEDQREDGGWSCSHGTPGTLDAWEALAAFACVPKSKRSRKMIQAIEKGAEFYLDRKMFKEGKRYEPWFRFHYPNHYFYDVLLGLGVITQLGFAYDRRLRPGLEIVRRKRLNDGTWLMDKSHPDIEPGMELNPPIEKIKPLVLEPAGKPSKWITLKSLTVLKRTDEAT